MSSQISAEVASGGARTLSSAASVVARARCSEKTEAGVAEVQEPVQPAAQKAGPVKSKLEEGCESESTVWKEERGAAAASCVAAAVSIRGLAESKGWDEEGLP